MSLLMVAALVVVGYVIVIAFVMALLVVSKRADQDAERLRSEHVRAKAAGARSRFGRKHDAEPVREDDAERVREEEAERDVVARHRAG